MEIFNCIPKTDIPMTHLDIVAYPFNLDIYLETKKQNYFRQYNAKYNNDYLEMKLKRLNKILEKDKLEYVNMATRLYDGFMIGYKNNNNFIKLEYKSDRPLCNMSKNAIDNFMYILRLRGWNVYVHEYKYTDDSMSNLIDEEISFNVNITIKSNQMSRL